MSFNHALLIGTIEDANYHTPVHEEYQDNPLIEALPPLLSPREVRRYMSSKPKIKPDERNLEPYQRIHCVMRLEGFLHPMTRHVELEQNLSTVIRQEYLARNPRTPNYARLLRDNAMSYLNPDAAESERPVFAVPSPTSVGRSLVTVSGMGKSTAVERLIMHYPQVILHTQPKHTQVVWVKLDCPHDGSLNTLCLEFFEVYDQLFGTDESLRLGRDSRTNKAKLVQRMRGIAAKTSLGVLIIDEIQNLNQASSGGKEEMINFFVKLVNSIGVPILLIGTPSMSNILHSKLRTGRRFGSIPGWDRFNESDVDWQLFLRSMWRFQWTKNEVPLTPEIQRVMYQETMGITDLAVKLFAITQMRAITTKKEKIDTAMLLSVAREAFYSIRPALDALRSGDEKELQKFDDIYEPIKLQDYKARAVEELDETVEISNNDDMQGEVVELLLQADIPEAIALRAVQQSKCTEKISWIRKAFEVADELAKQQATNRDTLAQSSAELEPYSTNGRSKRTAKNKNNTPMLDAVKKGKANGKTPYQSLLEAGYVQNPIEVFFRGGI